MPGLQPDEVPQPLRRLTETGGYRAPPTQLPVRELRAMWWRLRRREGVELPAEATIVILTGGKS